MTSHRWRTVVERRPCGLDLPASLAALTGLLGFLGLGGSVVAAPSPEQQGWLAQANRHEKEGWVYVHIEGSPRARGFQHGYMLAREVDENLRVQRALWRHSSAMEWAWLVERTKPLLEPKVDAESLAEIDGMVEGLQAAGVATTRAELIVYNAIFEIGWYWWSQERKKLGADALLPLKESCSSFIATGRATADRGIVLGHNSMVDYPEATANIIMDIQPERGNRILWQCWPGWLHSGTDFFVTSAGLVGSETTIGAFDGYDESGVPEFVRMRRATQDATSIDQWCAIMRQGNNGGYANAWLVGDVRSGEIARLELGLKHTRLERTNDGFFLGSNVAEDLKILRFETQMNENDIRLSAIARRVRWKQLMAQHSGRVDLKLAQAFEADHFDAFLRENRPNSRSLCAHTEIDAEPHGPWPGAPFYPAGTFDAKVVDSTLAREMSFLARWGAACGRPFDAEAFLKMHPQYDWMKGLLRSRPRQAWTRFQAGERQ